MKIVAYTALRYGRDYLGYAIQSIIDRVDEYHVLYAEQPSHGHYDPTPCPETREELYAIAQTIAGSKLRWHNGIWQHEGQQRNTIHEVTPDADVIIVLDADEIWSERTLNLLDTEINFKGSAIRIPFVHFWRSFHTAVLHDPAAPARVIFPHNPRKDWILDGSLEHSINHMGYAQRSEIVGYKMKIHGHKAELKPDWFETVFMDESRTTDLHPVGSQYWNVERVDPWAYLPDFMKAHKYANLEVIP